MEWIVKIEEEEDKKSQRIRITFNPLKEIIILYGECKIKNNNWEVFSEYEHPMTIQLLELQDIMGVTVSEMRKRLVEYNNLAEGFGVLKLIEISEE